MSRIFPFVWPMSPLSLGCALRYIRLAPQQAKCLVSLNATGSPEAPPLGHQWDTRMQETKEVSHNPQGASGMAELVERGESGGGWRGFAGRKEDECKGSLR